MSRNCCFAFRYHAWNSKSFFYVDVARPTGWVHVVSNFIGTADEMKIYHDGAEAGHATRIVEEDREEDRVSNEGTIFVGRFRPNSTSTFVIDEMLFFNAALSEDDITLLSTDNE